MLTGLVKKVCPGASPRPAAILIAAGLAAILLIAPGAYADKTDVVTLNNGSSIVGEIRSLSQGQLQYKTDDISTIYVNWDVIDHVTSESVFEVVNKAGLKYYGTLGSTQEPGRLVVAASDAGTAEAAGDTLAILDVVQITPIKQHFLSRLRGSLSAGFSYTKATSTAELSLSGNTTYRDEKYQGTLDYNAYLTAQADDTTSNYTAKFSFSRFLRRRWTVGVGAGAEANEELGLDMRLNLSLLGSRLLVETNKTVLAALVGVAGTREQYTGSDSTSYNIEIPLGFGYTRFTFHNPKSNIDIQGVFYVNLTTHDRYRATANASLNHEIATNLYLVLNSNYQYDNKPPPGSAKDDYRLNTTIQWTFG